MNAASNPTKGFPSWVDLGREICGSLPAAEEREWLVTNGIGGFASGTVAGLLTRRYHGLLIAALKPPLGRTLLATKLDETAGYAGQDFPLFTNRWAGGTIDPQGYRLLERFHLEGTTPVWTFACADARLEKRLWMQRAANTTWVRYHLLRARGPMTLRVKALVNYRDFHSTTQAGNWRMSVERVPQGLRLLAFEGATPFYLLSDSATVEPGHDWYRNFDLALERARGFEDREDHLYAGTFTATLEPGDSFTLAATTESLPRLDGRAAWEDHLRYELGLLEQWSRAFPQTASRAPAWIRQLILAADQFIVERPLPDHSRGSSIIAGYPWFGDWGRDSLIALPGLTLATGRPGVARKILGTWARYVDRGMLPNRFPEDAAAPAYNSVDAALWLVEAMRQYVEATHDTAFLEELFPKFQEIVRAYEQGTRYNIRADSADGLLAGGEPGIQLTWMDAKVGDWVVTPRIGKPVEVNALWHNALAGVAHFAAQLGKPGGEYEAEAESARSGFQRFWNEAAHGCFDVLDGPGGHDPALRPNQILAASLPHSPLSAEQRRAVVDLCAARLLTPFGLRSLAPEDSRYCGHYRGGPRQRDAAYHQGTVWGWLLGPFVAAFLRVTGDRSRATAFLEPFAGHLRAYGLGTAGEIFDGNPPHAPQGCIAQAWTVAEILRAWMTIANQDAETPRRPSS